MNRAERPDNATSDVELLSRWAEGDKSCGNQLIERHFVAVYRFFRTKVSADVDDLVQQTFLACFEGRSRYRRRSNFKTFLLAIARNHLYSYYRERKRNSVLDCSSTSMRDLGPSPTSALARREQEQLFLEALQSIPLEAQMLVELTYWEDLSGNEVAEILDVPVETIHNRLHRARAKLRETLEAIAVSSSNDFDVTFEALETWARRLRSEP